MNLHSYPSIYNLGHKAVIDLLNGPVIVEEKVDGSQFSFGVIDGVLYFRSKGADIYAEAPEKMFAKGVEAVTIVKDKLVPGWHYRGEYLQKPKHNSLAYDRTPTNHVVIFDIDRDGIGDFVGREEKVKAAELLGFDVIPELFRGKVETVEQLQELLKSISYLGGQQIEGVVIKPEKYDIWGPDKKVLMGKYVREEFRELNAKNFKTENPKQGDMVALIGQTLRTDARWHKAVQHLRERGLLEDSPCDIGLIIKEVPIDIEKECAEEVKEKLYKWAWPQIRRIATAGLPKWYKEQLLARQFEPKEGSNGIEESPASSD